MFRRFLLYFTLAACLGPAFAKDLLRTSVMSISPNGQRTAALVHVSMFTSILVTDLDTDTVKALPSPIQFGEYGVVEDLRWIDNEVLAVNLANHRSYAVDVSGRLVAKLGEEYLGALPRAQGEPRRVLVLRDHEDGDMDIVDLDSKERTRFAVDLPGRITAHAVDRQGVLRAVTMLDESRLRRTAKFANWYRAGASSPWQLLEEFPVTGDVWTPLAVLDQPGMLAVLSRHGRDTRAVYRYDTARREHLDVMAGHPTDDIERVDGVLDANFERVVTGGIKPTIHWFDADWAAVQATVDAALPGRINMLSGDPKRRVLISSWGDVDPGRWFVLNMATMKFREAGIAAPAIDPKLMRPKDTLSYVARDGLPIQSYLTRPPAQKGPGPTVVVIHGGPQARDTWAFDREVQVLALEGFVVFQPQFRGSTGFGARLEGAGYMQWGRAMQDDISDGVRYLVEQGIADPKRVCIYGASYGGYAALWGAISTPELYRCAASFMGVTDLVVQASGSWLDDSTVASREYNRSRLGDPQRNRAELDEVSPVRHAGKVSVPVFIAHGMSDRRVLPAHSERMVDALRAAGKPVEWMPLKGVGHYELEGDTFVRYNTALIKFLRQHLGPRDEVPAAPKEPPKNTTAAAAPPAPATN